jgi:phage terminase large subunit
MDDKILPREGTTFIHSTYKDNRFLSKNQIEAIEANKDDLEWARVYIEGKTGSKIGLIMQRWDIVDKFPKHVKEGRRYIGLDFGFANHPTAIIDIYVSDGKVWMDELCYQTRMDNGMISDFLKDAKLPKHVTIIADSAEPKSIHELRAAGWNIEAANKPAGSVNKGIEIMNRYDKCITQRSLNLIKECRNYRWKTDIDGKPTNEPIKLYDHAIDAVRYVFYSKLGIVNSSFDFDDSKFV